MFILKDIKKQILFKTNTMWKKKAVYDAAFSRIKL